jgi:small multidrug resistance family-3 protein
MRELFILVAAAVLEVGGDSLVRWGVRGGQTMGFVLGAIVLFAYGLVVNVPKWDMGRLLGVYIAVFFVVSQIIAYFFFHEKIKLPMLVGGALIVAGGAVMTFWHVEEIEKTAVVAESDDVQVAR